MKRPNLASRNHCIFSSCDFGAGSGLAPGWANAPHMRDAATTIFNDNCSANLMASIVTPLSVAGLYPVFVDANVLDGFAFRCEIAVRDVYSAIAGLDHRGIVILAVDRRIGAAVQVALPFPG